MLTPAEKILLQRRSVLLLLLGMAMVLLPALLISTSVDTLRMLSPDALSNLMLTILVVRIFGFGAMVLGLGSYASSKGYSSLYGALLFLPLVGLLWVLLLPDRYPTNNQLRLRKYSW